MKIARRLPYKVIAITFNRDLLALLDGYCRAAGKKRSEAIKEFVASGLGLHE